MKSSELNQRRQQATPRGVGVMCNYFVEKAENATLWDIEGNEVIDFAAGIAVLNTGHRHPKVVAAVAEQLQAFTHTAYQIVPYESYVSLAERINDLAPIDGPAKTAFFTTGAEAVENAVKIARAYTGRPGLITFGGGFHGRTLETIAATMQDWLQDSFRPLPGGFVACTPNDVDELRSIFKQLGSEVCAVMLEPIQGESGVHPMTEEFMAAARDLAHEAGAVLIADEVQCGIFRSGKPFAFQTYGVEPDIMSLAKGIADGVPMGAVVAKKEIADVFKPGDHGSTFGGSCLAVAACAATLSALVRGDYAEHAAKVGAYMEQALAKLPHVTEVRGRGLMLGCDLDDAAGDAHDIVARALAAGAVINATGAHTLRFLPPLVCEESDVDSLIEILSDVLA